MKKFITAAVVLTGTSIAGLLAWRKIESDRIRNDLWTEAEQAFAEQDASAPKQDQPAPAARV
ncbi:MAG: DLW-39 family protein [Brachybacterium sp.]|uniref:DLW-39 family protein n=1 Tax=Brachybacterium sp. TaxID=1891286 RepID=UPI0026555217|nr:DLW-39 family protein [Brachybacterium sp.]MDN6400220.1 DLW-39 family protein [Brachybacterium sp.]